MTTLTWLHIADTQFRSFVSKRSANNVIEDIVQQRSEAQLHLDLIFITGDIASTGKADEFKVAAGFFQELLSKTNVKRENIFFVPGNHDIDRGDKTTVRALGNYNDFMSLFLGNTDLNFSKEEQFLYYRRLRIANARVAILGLDTSWLDRTKNTNQTPEYENFKQQVYQGLNNANDVDGKIVLMHHSPDEFNNIDNGEFSSFLKEQCNFILHSHAHTKDLENGIQIDNRYRAIVINGGSNFMLEDRPNKYSIAQLNLDTGEGKLIKRNFNIKQGGWIQEGESVNIRFDTWLKKNSFGPVLAGYSNDRFSGPDRLGIMGDVEAFAAVLASRQTDPPLCLGLFGDWGLGKSFFMEKLKERIIFLADRSSDAEDKKEPTEFCSRIVNVDFNAWHYADSNLWASLACRIFQKLDDYLESSGQVEQKSELFNNLDTARQLKEDAIKVIDEIKLEKQLLENRLVGLRKLSANKENQLANIQEGIISEISKKDQYIQAKEVLFDAAKKLGLETTESSLENNELIIGEFTTLSGRIRILLINLLNAPDRWLRISLLVLLLIAVPMAPYVLRWLMSLINLSPNGFSEILSQFATLITGFLVWLGAIVRKASKSIDEYEKAYKKINLIIQNAKQPYLEKEQKLEDEIDYLRRQEETAKDKLIEAQQRFDEAAAALERLGKESSRSLVEFIRAQTTNEALLNQLGIVSLLRQNFETLSLKLEQSSRNSYKAKGVESSTLPRIDRIILYIDDLDRCPEEVVVEVLQSVHLLLAFKLFIVVVGVDSRWLLHSLERVYPNLRIDAPKREGWSEEEYYVWDATPQNYLEKIFQIPYNLRPMDNAGFKRLINSIVSVSSADGFNDTEFSQNMDQVAGLNDITTSAAPKNSANNNKYFQPQPTENIIGKAQSKVVITDSATSLNPEFLRIESTEQDFLLLLSDFLPTPRTAKRFVNIYRLIRATVSPDELEQFSGTQNKPNSGEFRSVMVLLAILTGFPSLASLLFFKILSLNKNYLWKDLIGLVRPRQLPNKNNEYCNGFLSTINTVNVTEWRRLYQALEKITIQNELPKELESYIKWTPQVSRFSFRTGKIADRFEPFSNIQIIGYGKETQPSSSKKRRYIAIKNLGDKDQDITGWTLSTKAHHTYVFPKLQLPSGSEVKIWECLGQDTPTDLFWGKDITVWNNDEDEAILRDITGTLVSTYAIRINL